MKVVHKEEIMRVTEEGVKADIAILENEIFPLLNYREKTRLLLAEIKYPLIEVEFDDDEPLLREANIIMRRLKDSLVAMGTEVVIDELLTKHAEGENNGNATTTTNEE